jgi:hypothetical protein
MSASTNKKHGWMEEIKKSASKKNVFENIEKERFLTSTSPETAKEIPEIDFIMDDSIEEQEEPAKTSFKKELNVDILKNSSVNLDTLDLSCLMEVLEPETEDEEKDEVWNWHQLFTKVTAEIADEK